MILPYRRSKRSNTSLKTTAIYPLPGKVSQFDRQVLDRHWEHLFFVRPYMALTLGNNVKLHHFGQIADISQDVHLEKNLRSTLFFFLRKFGNLSSQEILVVK